MGRLRRGMFYLRIVWSGPHFWKETAAMYRRIVTIAKIVKKGQQSFSKNLRYINAVSLQKLTPDVIAGYTAISTLILMKPSRRRAILLQKVDPIGFFNSRQDIGIGIRMCKTFS